MKSYVDFWRRYFDFTGESTRSQYWLAVLFNVLAVFVVMIIFGVIGEIAQSGIIAIGVVLYFIAAIIPTFSIQVRRLRNAGFPWGLIFLHLIPSLGDLVLLILYCMPSKEPTSQSIN